MTTPDPWRELEAKLSRSGYEDERETWVGPACGSKPMPWLDAYRQVAEAHGLNEVGRTYSPSEAEGERGGARIVACSHVWVRLDAPGCYREVCEICKASGPFVNAQRPSPEGLHAQKVREAATQFDTLPGHDEHVDEASAPHVIWAPRRSLDALRDKPPEDVFIPPLRCRIGWHRWRRYPWAAREPSAPIRCTRCPKEKP